MFNLFATHTFDCGAPPYFKMKAFTSKKAFECCLLYSVTFLHGVKERTGPPAVCRTNSHLPLSDVFEEKVDETEQSN